MTSRPSFALRTGLTLWFGLALTAWFAANALRWSAGEITTLTHVALSSPALYFLCICVHDGVHGVLVRPRWLNQLAANGLSVVVGLPFPLLQDAHLRHHRQVGDPSDPEHVIYDAELWQLPGRLVRVPWYYLREWVALRPLQQVWTLVQILGSLGLVAWFGLPALQVWVLPALVAIIWFGFTTVYVPHSRHADRLMPWFDAHSGWHHDHHHDVRYPWPQYVQIRVWRFDEGMAPHSRFEERVLRWLAHPL